MRDYKNHARRHAPDGSDPIPGGGSGIDFNKFNNSPAGGGSADYLSIQTNGTGTDPSMEIVNASEDGAFVLENDNDAALEIKQNGDGGLDVANNGDGDLNLHAEGSGDVKLHAALGKLLIDTLGDDIKITAGGHLIFGWVDPSDPGIPGAVYVDGSGFLKISP